jgi:predicted O-methyltransferase YrrM
MRPQLVEDPLLVKETTLLGSRTMLVVIACAPLFAASACRSQGVAAGNGEPTAGQVAGPRTCDRVIPFPTFPDNPTASPSKTFGEGYEFSEDWFTRNVPVWTQTFFAYRGQPGLRYLEVGTFEGMSVLWMLQNVLTDESSRAEGVDPYFDASVKARALANLEHSGHVARFKLHQGLSADVLPRLTPATYDIIYVDGSHTADDVLADAVLCWLLLKPGGLLVFDDWQMDRTMPEELRPAVAINAFITAYRRRLEVVHRGYQLVVRKSPQSACNTNPFCTQLGTHQYDVSLRKLRDAEGRDVELSDEERRLVEQLLSLRRFGAGRDEWQAADLEALDGDQLKALAAKLDLRFP